MGALVEQVTSDTGRDYVLHGEERVWITVGGLSISILPYPHQIEIEVHKDGDEMADPLGVLVVKQRPKRRARR